MSRDPPVVEPPFDARSRREATIPGVLLAAGTSSRFGDANKLTATVDGEPIVRRAARTLLDSAVDGVIVVVGHEADRVTEVLGGLDVDVAENPAYETGQATSMRTGVRAASRRGADAAVFALGDMPAVRTGTVDALVDGFEAGVGDPLVAAYRGERGNPVLFGARFFDALLDVEGDTGGRDVLLSSETTTLVETGDPGVRADVDRPEDLDALPTAEAASDAGPSPGDAAFGGDRADPTEDGRADDSRTDEDRSRVDRDGSRADGDDGSAD